MLFSSSVNKAKDGSFPIEIEIIFWQYLYNTLQHLNVNISILSCFIFLLSVCLPFVIGGIQHEIHHCY